MIANIVAQALEGLEKRAASPSMIRRGADLLNAWLDHGFDQDLVQKIQAARLADAVQYVYDHSPFYRERLGDLDAPLKEYEMPADMGALPFTTGDDIRDWQRFLCVPREELSAVFTTSGTMGEPKQVYFSRNDFQQLVNFSALALLLRHSGPLQVLVALPMNHGLWIGSGSASPIIHRAGGVPYPVGADDPQETLTWMQRFEFNVVISSPSYMTTLTQRAEKAGYRRSVDKIMLGGEILTEEQKARFQDYWSATILDSYGTTEMGGAQSLMLPGCDAFYLNDLHLYSEIVDPETGQPADEGELVFTTLTREAMPFLRYRSGDRVRWAECEGGLPFRTVQLLGRLDDLLVVGDMNLYGSVVADAVTDIPGAEGRVRIRVEREEMVDRLTLLVEGKEASPEEVRRALFSAYPKARTNVEHGILELEVRTGVDLSGQIKGFKIVDERA